MNVTVSSSEIVASKAKVSLTLSDKKEVIVAHDNKYDVVKKGEYTPYDLQAYITTLENKISILEGNFVSISDSFTGNATSVSDAIALINNAITSLGVMLIISRIQIQIWQPHLVL